MSDDENTEETGPGGNEQPDTPAPKAAKKPVQGSVIVSVRAGAEPDECKVSHAPGIGIGHALDVTINQAQLKTRGDVVRALEAALVRIKKIDYPMK